MKIKQSIDKELNIKGLIKNNTDKKKNIEIPQKQQQKLKDLDNKQKSNKFYRFRGIHSFLNDVEYQSLQELPIDLSIKRQLEDFIINPRKVDDEFKFQQKHNRLLFFGYSKEIMESTAKAISIENNWLFTEIDSQEIIMNYMDCENNMSEDNNIQNLFRFAKKESSDQKSTYMIVLKNFEKILIDQGQEYILQAREWLFNQLDTYNRQQLELESNGSYLTDQFDILVIMISSRPQRISEQGLKRLINQAVFFDFGSLKAIKLFLLQEMMKMVAKMHFDHRKYKGEHMEDEVNDPYSTNNYRFQKNDNINIQQGINSNYDRFKKVSNEFKNQLNSSLNTVQQQYHDLTEDGMNNNDKLLQENRRHRNYKNQNQQQRLARQKGENILRRNTQDFNKYQKRIRLNEQKGNNLPYLNFEQNYQNEVKKDQSILDQILTQNDDEEHQQLQQKMRFKEQLMKLKQYQDEYEENELDENGNPIKQQDHYQFKLKERKKDLERCKRYNDKKGKLTQMIEKNNLQIIIEKQQNIQYGKNQEIISGEDNILLIRGPNICIIFDWDFDSYLIDHALPIKTNINPIMSWHMRNYNNNNNNEDGNNQYFEKVGLIYEDVRNILKLAVHLDIKDIQQDDMELYNKEPSYQITEKTIKMGFINYKAIISLVEANSILEWARMHTYMIHKIQQLSLTNYHPYHQQIYPPQQIYDSPQQIYDPPQQIYDTSKQQILYPPQQINNPPQQILNDDYYDDDDDQNDQVEQKVHQTVVVQNPVLHHQFEQIHHHHYDPQINEKLGYKIKQLDSIESRINEKLSLLESKLNLFTQRNIHNHYDYEDDSIQDNPIQIDQNPIQIHENPIQINDNPIQFHDNPNEIHNYNYSQIDTIPLTDPIVRPITNIRQQFTPQNLIPLNIQSNPAQFNNNSNRQFNIRFVNDFNSKKKQLTGQQLQQNQDQQQSLNQGKDQIISLLKDYQQKNPLLFQQKVSQIQSIIQESQNYVSQDQKIQTMQKIINQLEQQLKK